MALLRARAVGAVLVVTGVLTGCSAEVSDRTAAEAEPRTDDVAPRSAGAPSLPTDRPWLVRLTRGARTTYVRLVPDSGATIAVTFREHRDRVTNPFLLVDAGREYALLGNAATPRQQETGRLRVRQLDGDRSLTIDLRELTGDAALEPLGWAFDPSRPAVLRVLTTTGLLYDVDVSAVSPPSDGPSDVSPQPEQVDVPDGFELAPTFDSRTGRPLLRRTDTGRLQEAGDYSSAGLAVRSAPDGACGDAVVASAAVTDRRASTWVACLEDRRVVLVRRDRDASNWRQVGSSLPVAPRRDVSMSWVLPAVG